MAYTDELDVVIAAEQRLRLQIAARIAEEAGQPAGGTLSEAMLAAADAAILAWSEDGEEQHDLAAFRSIGPLQELLVAHRSLVERIDDMLDRRLS